MMANDNIKCHFYHNIFLNLFYKIVLFLMFEKDTFPRLKQYRKKPLCKNMFAETANHYNIRPIRKFYDPSMYKTSLM